MMSSTHTAHHSQSTASSRIFRRRYSLTAVLIAAALGLSACGPNVPDPTDTAQQFADQLVSEEFSGLTDLSLTDDSIDPAALADALTGGKVAGAGLDVLAVEPPLADNPLMARPNCLITPHIAWATKEARVRLMQIAVGNLKGFIKGENVNNVAE